MESIPGLHKRLKIRALDTVQLKAKGIWNDVSEYARYASVSALIRRLISLACQTDTPPTPPPPQKKK
jgi:hypothetical protein